MPDYIPLAQRKRSKQDTLRAKALRKEAPMEERLLWNALRENTKRSAIHFRRQHPIPPYIVDFICIKALLIIEIDGPSHDLRIAHDTQRDMFLGKLGYEIIRFPNEEVRNNLENVVKMILDRVHERIEILYAPRP